MDVRKAACMAAAGFIGTLIVVATTQPAFGQPPVLVQGVRNPDLPTATIRFKLASLRGDAGVRQLRRRVGWAIVEVCPGNLSIPSFDHVQRKCISAAHEEAEPQILEAIGRAQRMAAIEAGLVMTVGVVGR